MPNPVTATSSTVKTILDAVVDELGILRPNGYVGSVDIQSRQLVSLFHATGDYLCNACQWQELIAFNAFNTSPGQHEYALPDYWGGFADETHWNINRHLRVYGRSLKDWAYSVGHSVDPLIYGVTGNTAQVKIVAHNNVFLIPTPQAVETIGYYFYRTAWVVHPPMPTEGYPFLTNTDRCQADDDVTMWADDRLLILGTKAAWLRAKRLSYDEEWAQFEERIRTQMAAQQDNETFSIDPAVSVPGSVQSSGSGLVVPSGNWGV